MNKTKKNGIFLEKVDEDIWESRDQLYNWENTTGKSDNAACS